MKKVIAIFIAFILGGCAAPSQPPPPTLPPSLTPTWTNSRTSSLTSTPTLTPTRTLPPGPPFVGKRLTLGTWQQVIYVDFDIRPHQLALVVQMVGD
jgi:hypothetical protein